MSSRLSRLYLIKPPEETRLYLIKPPKELRLYLIKPPEESRLYVIKPPFVYICDPNLVTLVNIRC